MDEKKLWNSFKKYPDNLVGLKTRISHGIIEADKVEASVRRTVEIAGEGRNKSGCSCNGLSGGPDHRILAASG